jgi:hypothetical protein
VLKEQLRASNSRNRAVEKPRLQVAFRSTFWEIDLPSHSELGEARRPARGCDAWRIAARAVGPDNTGMKIASGRRIALLLGVAAMAVVAAWIPAWLHHTRISRLVRRLEGPWQLEETMKAYWFGYTKDMYAIAAHKGEAIEPLVDLARWTRSPHALGGALLTLHLVGIESTVVGRFDEAFKSKKARDALLSLLAREDCQEGVLTLLIRDPWPTDVPALLEHLGSGTSHAWAFVKALQRYKIHSRPVHQDLPEDLAEIEAGCSFETTEEYWRKSVAALSPISTGWGPSPGRGGP